MDPVQEAQRRGGLIRFFMYIIQPFIDAKMTKEESLHEVQKGRDEPLSEEFVEIFNIAWERVCPSSHSVELDNTITHIQEKLNRMDKLAYGNRFLNNSGVYV